MSDPDRVAALIAKWRKREHDSTLYSTCEAFKQCADELEAALAVPVVQASSPTYQQIGDVFDQWRVTLPGGHRSISGPDCIRFASMVSALYASASPTQALAAAGEPRTVTAASYRPRLALADDYTGPARRCAFRDDGHLTCDNALCVWPREPCVALWPKPAAPTDR